MTAEPPPGSGTATGTGADRPTPIAQPILTGVVASLTGFASSFALVVAGLHAVGADDAQAASGLLAVSVLSGLGIILSLRTRQPISFAWSTPGAALLIAAGALTDNFNAAVGAFLVCGALILLCGVWPLLGRLITSIPRPIASAMLAGILMPICLTPVTAAIEVPWLALPVIVVWLVLARFASRWATPGAMLTAAVGIAVSTGGSWPTDLSLLPTVVPVVPTFDPLVIVSLGIPLFIVTMAGQNVPGFAVMSTLGYTVAPRPVLVASGVGTMIASFAGGHAVNLAAITAAISAGPDAHPDPKKRWIASTTSGIVFVFLGLAAGAATALIAAAPPVLITAVAGLALLGTLVASVVAAMEEPDSRIAAVIALLVTASGIAVLGIGSAFWGLVVGGLALLLLRKRR